MKKSEYNSYDDLPLFLNAKTVAARMVVPKEQFLQWVSAHTEGGGCR